MGKRRKGLYNLLILCFIYDVIATNYKSGCNLVAIGERAVLNRMGYTKKLIEVALPLDAINKASAREKSIRQ